MIVELIRKKRDGHALSPQEIRELIAAYTADRVPDYQVAALLMAIFWRGMQTDELAALTDAMLHSGDVVDLSMIDGAKVDKHSTGGVGDKVSLHLAPAVAACGVRVPMISGRGLGHTGGTLDKLESIPGFRVDLSIDRFREVLRECGLALIGQTERLVPADKRLYALRDVTSTVESIPLIAASIMSKKLAEGIDGLVLDVKVGSGAFMKTLEKARELAQTLVAIGRAAGKRVTAFITDMDQPLGHWIGNSVEVRESLDVLEGRGPADLVELTLALGSEMLVLGGAAKDEAEGRAKIAASLADGSARARFVRCVELQGGKIADDGRAGPIATESFFINATRKGFVSAIDAEAVGRAGVVLGAGRAKKEDAIDPAAFIHLMRKVGDPVHEGQTLVRFSAPATSALANDVRARLTAAFTIAESAPLARPLVLEVIR